jgi:ComF family protein
MPPLLIRMSEGFRSAAGTAWRSGVDFVYERACPRCRCELAHAADAAVDRAWPRLCEGCAGEVAPPLEFTCFRCGAPVGPYLETSDGCVHCRDDRFAFERAVALGVYDESLRLACLSIKSSGAEALAAALGHLLWRRNGDELRRLDPEVIVPVPHHWMTRLSRGHNAAATIAGVLASRLRRPLLRAGLRKVRFTPSQTSLTPTERRANLRGAFQASRRRRLTGRRVLLVDDVLTTGTTAHRAARALLEGGAAAVVVAVIARGIGRGAM